MHEFIAALLAILGTLLVLAGATVSVIGRVAATPSADPAEPGNRVVGFLRNVTGADRLIAWGVLLLVLAAIASGAISFNLGASAGTR